MNQVIVTILRVLFGSLLAIATLITTIVMSPILLLIWIRKKLTDFSRKK